VKREAEAYELESMSIVSDSVGDAGSPFEITLDDLDVVASWLDAVTTVITSIIEDEVVKEVAELDKLMVVEVWTKLSNTRSDMTLVGDDMGSVLEADRLNAKLVRFVTGVSAAGTMVSLVRDTSDGARTGVELSKVIGVVSSGTAVLVLKETSRRVFVVLSIGISVVEIGISVVEIAMLLGGTGVKFVEELTVELIDDDALHLSFKPISAFLGTMPFCAGRVEVHSFSSLIFLTPRRDSRR
jgi:hypothetical protein